MNVRAVWMPLLDWSDLLWQLPVAPKRNLRLTQDLLFWRSVVGFAYSLLARGWFTPGWRAEGKHSVKQYEQKDPRR